MTQPPSFLPSLNQQYLERMADTNARNIQIILDWTQQSTLPLVLAEPPVYAPQEITVKPYRLPILKKQGGSGMSATAGYWPEHDLAGARHPYIGCVLEGITDMRIGLTEAMASQQGRKGGGYCLRLPQKSIFLFPPGLPHSAGLRPHWEGPDAQGHSRILWLHITPQGAMMHTCQTSKNEHLHQPGQFFLDAHLALITGAMVEELRGRSPQTQAIARTLLTALLQRLAHTLSTQSGQPGTLNFQDTENAANSSHDEIAQRACRYIQTNLPQPLSVAEIAANSYVSQAQLNRLFQRQFQTSVMEYVIEQRIETIKFLLENTQMSIRHISDHLGYHTDYLSQLFKGRTGISPTNYRRKNRKKNVK